VLQLTISLYWAAVVVVVVVAIVGDWLISVVFEGEHVDGSPFNVSVYDPGRVKVTGLKGATLGKPYIFTGM